jgi:hypothetical protein
VVAIPLAVEVGLKLPQEFAGVQLQFTPFAAESFDTVAVTGADIPMTTVVGAAGLNATAMAGGGGGGGPDGLLPQPLRTTAQTPRTRGVFQFMAEFLSSRAWGSRSHCSSEFSGAKSCSQFRESTGRCGSRPTFGLFISYLSIRTGRCTLGLGPVGPLRLLRRKACSPHDVLTILARNPLDATQATSFYCYKGADSTRCCRLGSQRGCHFSTAPRLDAAVPAR